MAAEASRAEILDLLSRGKISIDQAVEMLDASQTADDGPVYKAETGQAADTDDVVALKVGEFAGLKDESETIATDAAGDEITRPRWLRVRVTNGTTGKNKVTVNVPMAMVKFGLGIARIISPDMPPIDLDEFGEMFNEVESGLLVDVQDDESNEHVRVFVE